MHRVVSKNLQKTRFVLTSAYVWTSRTVIVSEIGSRKAERLPPKLATVVVLSGVMSLSPETARQMSNM